MFVFFFFKQKTAYEMRISDWSSDVCSSDLQPIPDDGTGSFLFSSMLRRKFLVVPEFVSDRVALDHEPPAAALCMVPLLTVNAQGIGAHENVIAPFPVAQFFAFDGPYDIGLAAATEFDFSAFAAPGTFDQQHG